VIQPRPGSWNGIEFRSQLEIKWAQWFDKQDLDWLYVDEKSHDFDIMHKDGPTDRIEVKPAVPELCALALGRFPELMSRHPDDVGNTQAVLLIGDPPSPYSRGCGIICDFVDSISYVELWLALDLVWFGSPPVKDGKLRFMCQPCGPSYLSSPDCAKRLESICRIAIETARNAT